MDEYKYEKVGGEYLLKDPRGQILWRAEEVAIAYDGEGPDSTLLKHGMAEKVQTYYDQTVAALKSEGEPDLAASLRILRTRELPCEELNRCITISGYVGRMIDRLNRQYRSLADDSPSP